MAALKRAAETRNSLESVVALWEAVEFYVAETQTDCLFGREDLESLRKVTASWPAEKRSRADDRIAQLNEPSMQMKLQAALEAAQVPFTPQDVAILKRVRRARNDIVHGRASEPPRESDLRSATAFVNRMIVYRLHQDSRATDKP